MLEIEKMYKNAGVEPYRYCHNCKDDNGKRIENSINCPSRKSCVNTCDTPEYDFTPEKQLELIKLLSYYYNINISKNFENDYTFQCQGDDVRRYVFTSGQDFAEQIASFVNMCYELLPETEQKQIRSILNG